MDLLQILLRPVQLRCVFVQTVARIDGFPQLNVAGLTGFAFALRVLTQLAE